MSEGVVDKTAVQNAALNNETIEKYGLTFYGLKMRQYEEWAEYKNVWLSRQSTLPVFCVSYPFLQAIFLLDMKAIEETGKPAGLLYRIMYCLGMALGFDENCVREQRIYIVPEEDEQSLKAIAVKVDSETTVEITPAKFNKIRKIVAWMQGDELPDETLNDDLLDTERLLRERDMPRLDYSLIDMKASVAYACGIRMKDIQEWTILEFETMRRAIDRAKRFNICGIGETNGCKWGEGNPYPSWCFDKEEQGTIALIAQDQFGKAKTHKKE